MIGLLYPNDVATSHMWSFIICFRPSVAASASQHDQDWLVVEPFVNLVRSPAVWPYKPGVLTWQAVWIGLGTECISWNAEKFFLGWLQVDRSCETLKALCFFIPHMRFSEWAMAVTGRQQCMLFLALASLELGARCCTMKRAHLNLSAYVRSATCNCASSLCSCVGGWVKRIFLPESLTMSSSFSRERTA